MTDLALPWWQSATAYQIYPRSFANSDGDGIGDIPGIISRLDYLAELGVGFIWLSPAYASPMADNGYDISDYQDIAPEFGTLADFDALLARARGIGIVMDLVALKRVFNKWQAALASDGWNSLFWGNHDLPRAVSKYGDDGKYRVESAKMLATALHLMKGTPYIYQGEEFGMTNAAFTAIGQFRDVETLNHYALQTAAGVSPADFIAGANENGRDNARTPVQWTAGLQAGFTTGTPWIEVTPNYPQINATQRGDGSIFAHYQALAALRRAHRVISHGSYVPLAEADPAVLAYLRIGFGERLLVVANFTGAEVAFNLPPEAATAGRCLINNMQRRDAASGRLTLAPYEAFAVLAQA